jgi:hypothetical protein
MAKFLTYLFTILVVAYLLQLAIYFPVKKILNQRSGSRFERYYRQPKHQYVVVGSSHLMYAVNELYARDSLNTDLINITTKAMPYKICEAFVEDINQKNVNSTVIVDITSLSQIEFDELPYAFYISNFPVIKKVITNPVYRFIPLLQLNNELFMKSVFYTRKASDAGESVNIFISGEEKEHVRQEKPSPVIKDYPEFLSRANRIKKICEERGNNVVFVFAPYLKSLLAKKTDYPLLETTMKNNGLPFVDLNSLEVADHMFLDPEHMNGSESKQVTALLLKSIIQLRKIPAD